MKSTNQVEFAAGLFLLLGIVALVFLAIQATNSNGLLQQGSYNIVAHFANVGGLKSRASVSMAGVKIGVVDVIELDPDTLEARVVLKIFNQFDDLPNDSSASVLTAGILGDQYIGLEPGGSPEPLLDGDRILVTNSAMVLEQLISRYLFNSNEEDSK